VVYFVYAYEESSHKALIQAGFPLKPPYVYFDATDCRS